jgi:hypothetical protein
VLSRAGARIAVIGVLYPRGLGDDLGQGLAVLPMETVLPRLLPALRRQADLVVLLAFADEAALARLAREFYELDVILGGRVPQPAQHLVKVNRSLVYFTANESRTLGSLRLRLAGPGRVEPVAGDIRLLVDTIPEDPAIQALAAAYRDEVRQARLSIDSPGRLAENMVPGVRVIADFTGSEACLQCHASAAWVWTNSAHARAFATLVRKQADADPKCIGCHTVGFGLRTGYRREYGSARLVHVGCEGCHGPGSLHVRQHQGDRSVSHQFRPLGAGDCQQCHYGEFSRPFDWNTFWPLIAHGSEKAMQSPTASAPKPASPSL